MHFNVYDVFCSPNSQQHVLAVIAVIFMVMLLLQEHKDTNVVSRVTVTPQKLKIIILLVIYIL